MIEIDGAGTLVLVERNLRCQELKHIMWFWFLIVEVCVPKEFYNALLNFSLCVLVHFPIIAPRRQRVCELRSA